MIYAQKPFIHTICGPYEYKNVHPVNAMCGLQAKFFHAPSFPDLEHEIATLHDELVQKMDRADRRKLLELGDLTDELSSRITLASFTAGFKLAAGIAAELSISILSRKS